MKRIVLIISAILSLATLQAQVATNDIVTISCFANNTRSYLEASANRLHLTTKVNDNCLWIVTKSGNNYSFKTVATPTQYLYVSASTSGWLGLSASATLQLGSESTFTISNASSGNGYTSGELYYSYKPNRTTYKFYLTVSNGSWAAEHNNATQIDIEKWTNKKYNLLLGISILRNASLHTRKMKMPHENRHRTFVLFLICAIVPICSVSNALQRTN